MAEVLRHVWELHVTLIFVVMKNYALTLPQQKDKKQKTDLALLVDTFEHLNDLSVLLQERGLLIHESHTAVQAFKTELLLTSKQVVKNKCTHFPTL
jgi:hypothetical protein